MVLSLKTEIKAKICVYLTISITLISLNVNTRAFGAVADGRQKAREAAMVPDIIK